VWGDETKELKRMKKIIGLLLLLVLAAVTAGADTEIKTIPLYIGSEKFVVEIADTVKKQMLGLMYRESIPDDYGMLFVYPGPDYHSMWMKNCKVNLDIIFLDNNKRVINMYINVPPCFKEPCESYPSKRPARYALELRGNRAKELNLQPGDAIFFIVDK
jgi:uncharacterized membrane protein (UPF0127 family)